MSKGSAVRENHVSLARQLEPIPLQSCDSCVSRCARCVEPKSLVPACQSCVACGVTATKRPTPCASHRSIGPDSPCRRVAVPQCRSCRAPRASGRFCFRRRRKLIFQRRARGGQGKRPRDQRKKGQSGSGQVKREGLVAVDFSLVLGSCRTRPDPGNPVRTASLGTPALHA